MKTRKQDVDEKGTESMVTKMDLDSNGTKVADAVKLDASLAFRYNVKYVTISTFDHELRKFRNQENESKISVLVCFARDDQESASIRKKIRTAFADNSFHVVFIDATTTLLGEDAYEQYREEMAHASYQKGKNADLEKQYTSHAQSVLKDWKTRIERGTFLVYTEKKPTGERAVSMEELMSLLKAIDRDHFPLCPEGAFHVIGTMYTTSNLKMVVECGVTRTVRGTFRSANPNTSLKTVLKGARTDPKYWKTRPNLPISRIKLAVDQYIQKGFTDCGRVSIRSIYELLQGAPYGFLPCNLSAFLMGFLLKEYVDSTYT